MSFGDGKPSSAKKPKLAAAAPPKDAAARPLPAAAAGGSGAVGLETAAVDNPDPWSDDDSDGSDSSDDGDGDDDRDSAGSSASVQERVVDGKAESDDKNDDGDDESDGEDGLEDDGSDPLGLPMQVNLGRTLQERAQSSCLLRFPGAAELDGAARPRETALGHRAGSGGQPLLHRLLRSDLQVLGLQRDEQVAAILPVNRAGRGPPG